MSDGLLTGTTDKRLQVLDEEVLLLVDRLMAETDFTAIEVIDAFLRRVHVMRSY